MKSLMFACVSLLVLVSCSDSIVSVIPSVPVYIYNIYSNGTNSHNGVYQKKGTEISLLGSPSSSNIANGAISYANDIYVYGSTYDSTTERHYGIYWKNKSEVPLLQPNDGLNSEVISMAIYNQDIYVLLKYRHVSGTLKFGYYKNLVFSEVVSDFPYANWQKLFVVNGKVNLIGYQEDLTNSTVAVIRWNDGYSVIIQNNARYSNSLLLSSGDIGVSFIPSGGKTVVYRVGSIDLNLSVDGIDLYPLSIKEYDKKVVMYGFSLDRATYTNQVLIVKDNAIQLLDNPPNYSRVSGIDFELVNGKVYSLNDVYIKGLNKRVLAIGTDGILTEITSPDKACEGVAVVLQR